MKRFLNIFISLSLAGVLLCGCAKTDTTGKYDTNAPVKPLNTQSIASNDKFELSWNDEGKFICLYNKETEKMWSGVPYKYFQSEGSSDNVNSPLNITVANAAKAQWDTISGYTESVKKNKVSTEKIDDGIKVTYYFDNYSISIPVKYKLLSEGLNISLDSSEIVEEGSSVLLSVALAPFLCSAENISEDSYLFIPSGSGALMYVDERAEGTRKYTAEVYGDDASRLLPEEIVNDTKIYLPVYGVKEKNDALFAVIDKGAEYAEIYAEAGNRRTGYSTVYPTFYLRGYDVVETDQWIWGYRDLNRISDKKINAEFSISYYPLSGEESDYNGMANKYKEITALNQKGDSNSPSPDYLLNILGGVTYKSASWGIPHKELYTLTTFKEAENIISALNKATDSGALAILQGYTASGIDIGEIGGGFKLSKNYGKKSELKSLLHKCKDTKTQLALDFDVVRFSKSSNGFSYMLDSAKSATLRTANKYGINIPLRSYNDEEYRLLKRSELNSAVEKLIEFIDKNSFENVSLSTLGSIAYSDFDEEKYSIKGNISSQVSENIEKLKKSDLKVSVSDANAYAANVADILLDIPENNGGYLCLDESIPFYQMVYCGNKAMYSKALNLSENINKSVVDAVSTGVRFGFTVAQNYDKVCATSKVEKLYGTKFSANEDKIIDLINSYSDYYNKISGSEIDNYVISENGISTTVFENGTTVYANHSNGKVETSLGVFEAYEIKIIS